MVLSKAIDYSEKVHSFISSGDFTKDDLIQCIASATKIHKIEPDEKNKSHDGLKYTIYGTDTFCNKFYTCGKILINGNGNRIYYFITAHLRTK